MSLFAHYPADPGLIRACAEDLFAGSSRVGDVASTVTGRHEGAVAAVAGVLMAPLSSAVLPVSQAARSVSAAATVAGGALRLFAAAVATYNAGVDELNRRFDAARAAGFNSEPVTAAPGESLTAADERRYDHRVSEAKTRLVVELGLEEARLRADLDAAAETTAAVLDRGPTPDSMQFLSGSKGLPAATSLVFSGVGSDDDDHTELWAPGPIDLQVDLSEDDDGDDGFFPNWMHDAAGGVKDAGEWTWDHKGDIAHGALDAGGMVPGFGEPMDGINALWYLAEGNKTDAGLSAAGMIPFAGWGSIVAKRGDDVVDLLKGADDVPVPKKPRDPGIPTPEPGNWAKVNESMSDRAREYQARVTGRSDGFAYEVNGVRFDGYRDGVLQEAKGPGYAHFAKNGNFPRFYEGRENLRKQAKRQLEAADGRPVEWLVAEEEAIVAMRRLLKEYDIEGIHFKHVP